MEYIVYRKPKGNKRHKRVYMKTDMNNITGLGFTTKREEARIFTDLFDAEVTIDMYVMNCTESGIPVGSTKDFMILGLPMIDKILVTNEISSIQNPRE